MEVTTTGPCTFGAGSTQVLGGNMFSFKSAKNKIDDAAKILIPFQFAWPVSLILLFLYAFIAPPINQAEVPLGPFFT